MKRRSLAALTFNGRKVRATLHREDLSKYVLIGRGFHWNEHPFNQ